MRVFSGLSVFVVMVLAASTAGAQGADAARAVAGGGIFAPGWTGKIDANEEKAGQVLNNSKLSQVGDVLHVTTGPATAYWSSGNQAAGNYTVKATFTEPKYMNVNDHPHPYGIFIGGRELGTAQQTLSLLRGLRRWHLHRPWLRAGGIPAWRSPAAGT